MKRPAFLFYPDGWMRNANLRRCSPAARGAWIDVMCLMHDSDEYGVLRWPLADIAQSIGVPLRFVRELVDKSVLKGLDKGVCEPFVFVPRSGRREGAPVELLAAQAGPIWFSSRMVRDEYVRSVRGESTRFQPPNPSPDPSPKPSPKPPLSDGLAVAVAVAGSSLRSEPLTQPAAESPRPAEAADGDPPGRPVDNPDSGGPDLLGDTVVPRRTGPPACPVQAIVDAYHEALPELPRVERLTEARRAAIRQRWREWWADKRWPDQAAGLDEMRRFFGWIRRSRFLMGQGKPRTPGGSPFIADLAWLMNAENHAKVFEGRYHDDAAA